MIQYVISHWIETLAVKIEVYPAVHGQIHLLASVSGNETAGTVGRSRTACFQTNGPALIKCHPIYTEFGIHRTCVLADERANAAS